MYRRSTKQRVALLALLAATVTVVTLDFRANPGGPVRRVQDAAVSVVGPLQEAISQALRPVGEFLSGMGELPRLRSENVRLRGQIQSLEQQQREIPEILRENERLRELLRDQDWKSGVTLGGRVVSGPVSNLEASRLINKGTEDGVAEGMSVVSAEGLVGRIVFAAPRYSKILLMIDPRHAVGARLTKSGETGVIVGRNENDLLFDFISPGAAVDVGETVVTSGYDQGIYPPGIPLGRVTQSTLSRDRLSKIASVRPFVDFGRLDFVLILMESGPLTRSEG